jgi:serine/threonine protein kinase
MEAHGYTDVEMLGSGSYGRVYKARDEQGNQCVVKQMIFGGNDKGKAKMMRDMAMKESQILESFRHPNIVRYHNSFMMASLAELPIDDSVCVVMSHCSGGDLGDAIERQAELNSRFSEAQIFSWLAQMAAALAYMHNLHVLHRDLKSKNVFLTATGLLKLGDFGMSRVMQDTFDLAESCVGTPSHMSPEMLEGQPYGATLWNNPQAVHDCRGADCWLLTARAVARCEGGYLVARLRAVRALHAAARIPRQLFRRHNDLGASRQPSAGHGVWPCCQRGGGSADASDTGDEADGRAAARAPVPEAAA